MDAWVIVFAFVVAFIGLIYHLLGGFGVALLFVAVIGFVVWALKSSNRKKEKEIQAYVESEYVQKAFELIDFLESTNTGIHLVYVAPTYIAAWIARSNDRLENLGVDIEIYMNGRSDPRPEFVEAHHSMLMEAIAKYFGGHADVFTKLGLDVGLVNGDNDRPTIKRSLYMPNYESEADNYIQAIERLYENKYGHELSVVRESDMH